MLHLLIFRNKSLYSVNLLLSVMFLLNMMLQIPTAMTLPIVPKIEEKNFQLIPIDENKYHLSINLPDGSEREEIVELKKAENSADELSIQGATKIFYSNDNKILKITYNADKNGYVASYKYEGILSTKASFDMFARPLSADTLKIVTG